MTVIRLFRHWIRGMALAWPAMFGGCASVSNLSADDVRRMDNASICYLNATKPVGFIPLEFDRRTRDRNRPLDCRNHEEEILAALHRSDSVSVPPGVMNQRDCSGITLGEKLTSQTTRGQDGLGPWKLTTYGSYRRIKNSRSDVAYVLFSVEDKEGRGWERILKFAPNQEELVRFNQLLGGPVEVSIIGCKAFR